MTKTPNSQDIMSLSLADSLCFRLLQAGYKVQRYNSETANSIYIKLDYGAGNSIRISNHSGKKHLKYRFNVDTTLTGVREEKAGRLARFFYGIDSIDRLMSDIEFQKTQKINRYGLTGYKRLMEQNKIEHCNDSSGFWSKSYELVLDSNGNMIRCA